MKNILTILGLSIFFVANALPVQCLRTQAECDPLRVKGIECLATEHFSIAAKYGSDPEQCTANVMEQYESKEKQKYELREGRQAPADLMTATTSELELGNSQAGTIQLLPVVGGFSIMAALVVGLFIFFRK